MESWELIDWLVAAGSVAAVIGLGWWRSIWRAIRRSLTRFKPTVPRETIRAMPFGRPWWHMGSSDNQPAMQIVTRWMVTNIVDRPAILSEATLRRGWYRRSHQAEVILNRTIEEGETSEVLIDFWARPPFRKKGKSFRARLTITDHLGNPHNTPWITIPSDWRPRPEKPKPPEEAIHLLETPLLKKVVAILKDEVSRYRECGRQVSGLGSVRVTYENRTLNGIGYQGRQSHSAVRQWIVVDPDNAKIHSDNLDALLRVYDQSDPAGKAAITDALECRIDGANEYAAVGYFFLLFMFRIGRLSEVLTLIKDKLPEGPDFAFDNSVMMLSGLLQYEHPRFDDAALDDVERFMEGLDGHQHHLRERVIAARATKDHPSGNPVAVTSTT